MGSAQPQSHPTVAKLHYVACGGLLTYATQLFTKATPTSPNLDSTYCVWRISRGVVRITKNNLDQGSAVTPAAVIYAKSMDDSQNMNGVAGQVLGKMLGGSGSQAQNIIPASAAQQPKIQALETQIYKCLQANPLTAATIKWDFSYRTGTSSRPYLITYTVDFSEPNGAFSKCTNILAKFDN